MINNVDRYYIERKYHDTEKTFNNSGAVMIWTDYDHVVPDCEPLMNLGFVGIRERARKYRTEHKKKGTLNDESEAFFVGIEIEYTAIIDLIDRIYHIAKKQKFEKADKIAKCLQNLRAGKPTDFYEALQMIYIYFIISECVDSYQARSLGNGLDGDDGYTVFRAILMTNLKGDGQSIQFNVFNVNTLRDAQKNPEKYQNLQVRVCGWNNMSKQEQDAYILRTENIQ